MGLALCSDILLLLVCCAVLCCAVLCCAVLCCAVLCCALGVVRTGICWLAATPGESLESGGFYLDREPQVKHIAGPFITEGSRTKNTTDEVAELMKFLREASRGGSWNQGKWTP